MIYVSSSCSKQKRIGHAIQELVVHGFRNIELSGGTEYYDGYEKEVFEMKEQYNLNYIIHNYFPPPEKDFVLNLASLDDSIYYQSIEHLRQAIQLSKKIGAALFGFHAGYFVDVDISEVGNAVAKKEKIDTERALERFCNGFDYLKKEAGSVTLYVENNVYSCTNFDRYGNDIPFMLINARDCLELKKRIDFNLLLDVSHLYVSSKTLRLDFDDEFEQLFSASDYLHLSDSDGFHDQNLGFTDESNLFQKLSRYNIADKAVTLEIYSDLRTLEMSHDMISDLMSGNIRNGATQ